MNKREPVNAVAAGEAIHAVPLVGPGKKWRASGFQNARRKIDPGWRDDIRVNGKDDQKVVLSIECRVNNLTVRASTQT
ncbi:hypothetical protein [Burkholderia sp. YIM B11467]